MQLYAVAAVINSCNNCNCCTTTIIILAIAAKLGHFRSYYDGYYDNYCDLLRQHYCSSYAIAIAIVIIAYNNRNNGFYSCNSPGNYRELRGRIVILSSLNLILQIV